MKNNIQKHLENQGWEVNQYGYLRPNDAMLARLGLGHMKSWNKLLKGELKIDAKQLHLISKEFNIPQDQILAE